MINAFRGRLRLAYGSRLLRQGQWQQAEAQLRRALDLAPGHWVAHEQLAYALLQLERWEEAGRSAQRAIHLRPSSTAAHGYFGVALLKLERWDEAVAAYRRAIAAGAVDLEAYDRLGLAFTRLGRWPDVAEACERAAALAPTSRERLERLGCVRCVLRQWDAAAHAFRRAWDLTPDRADEFRDLPAEHAALVYWRRVSFADDAPETSLRFPIDLIEPPATEATLAAHRQAVAARPGSAIDHLGLGLELLKAGRWAEADEVLQRGATLTEANAGFQFLRVDPLLRLGRSDEALTALDLAHARPGVRPALPGAGGRVRFGERRAALWAPGNLPSDVLEIERWLASLAPANAPARPSSAPRRPQLLFVVDNDYGELTTLMYLMLGQPLARESTLLLPERLFRHNANLLPGRTYRYTGLEDILAAVDREVPDIVFLCSGYLFAQHELLTDSELAQAVFAMRARGIRLVTTDPFLGLFSEHAPEDVLRIELPTHAPHLDLVELTHTRDARQRFLCASFAAGARLFARLPHLYPVPAGREDRSGAHQPSVRARAFFNEHLVRPKTERDLAQPPDEEPRRPLWLFILAHVDWEAQVLVQAPNVFIDLVERKLVETVAAGRRAVVIGPDALVDGLTARLPTSDGIDVLSYCSFERFTSLLLGAEVVFYWNLVSHSLLIRLFTGLPIVLFDRGHLVRNIAPLEERIVAWYYQGFRPAYRDARERLTPERVAEWTADQQRESPRLTPRYRRAPTPDAMIDAIMADDDGAASAG